MRTLEQHIRRRRVWVGLVSLAAAVLLAASIGSWFFEPQYSHARYGVRLSRGTLELARGSHDLTGAGDHWRLSSPLGWAAIRNQASSAWRPTCATAQMLIGSTPSAASRMRLDQVFVPLWPWALLLGALAGLLWRFLRPAPRHACHACGYDLRGTRGGVCPECGVPSVKARIVQIVGRLGGAFTRRPCAATGLAAGRR